MEIFRALGALSEPPAPEHRELAKLLDLGPLPESSTYSELFLFQLYPYASVYLGPEGMLGGEARDKIAGFWRALEETPPTECDHLSVMLALYARLCDLESEASEERQRAFWAHARRAFFWEHLASWLPIFLDKLGSMADGYYRAWGTTLAEALAEETRVLEAPEAVSIHLREAEPLVDPREGGGEPFLDELLVPVRSGMILVRSDLERAARKLDIGLRAGERKYALKALFGQDSVGMLGWLEREARRWAEIHARRAGVWATITEFWEGRAVRTAELIEELRRDDLGA